MLQRLNHQEESADGSHASKLIRTLYENINCRLAQIPEKSDYAARNTDLSAVIKPIQNYGLQRNSSRCQFTSDTSGKWHSRFTFFPKTDDNRQYKV